MTAHGHFHWNELLTRDVEGAKKFYGQTIGWTFDSMPTPDGCTYWIAMMGGLDRDDGRPSGRRSVSDRPAPSSKACPRRGCPISRSMTLMRG